MFVKTQAIVLHKIKYSDSDAIVCLYSREFGRISYLVSNKSKKSKLSQSLLQPLSLIEYEGEHKGSRELQRLREAHCYQPFADLPLNPYKNAISLFLSEVLYRVLMEEERNLPLYDYLEHGIQMLDLSEKGTANFHLAFLIHLTKFLGFYPNLEENRPHWYFDLAAGSFCPARPPHNAWLSPEDAARFATLLRMNFDNLHLFRFDRHQRTDLLRQILDYYRIHLTDFPEIKSLTILEEMFDDQVLPH